MNNTEARSSRSLVYSFFPTLRQADTQIPLINWDTGSRHVNTEEDKQATVGAPYLFLLCFCAPLFGLKPVSDHPLRKGDVLTVVEEKL